MDTKGRRIWQQAAGDTNRDYADLCLEWDVILNGPARFGPWPNCEPFLRENGIKGRKITDLRRFCEQMREKDLVILRRGTKSVTAVGEIVGCYEYHDEFNDVDGWDLAHVRRVHWLWKGNEQPEQFGTYTLKWGDTTQVLDAPEVKSWLESLDVTDADHNIAPADLPGSGVSDITVNDISEYLFGKGVASASISNLMNEIGEFVRIANWYNREVQKPSEHETVNYLVVPLLRALGWTPQRMAIEWNRIDLALFSKLPREKESLLAVVEAKKMNSSCLSAFSQAKHYALLSECCERLIVTDGLRYGVFARDGKFSSTPHAYMNLTRLRRDYPLYRCKGAQDALLCRWHLSCLGSSKVLGFPPQSNRGTRQ